MILHDNSPMISKSQIRAARSLLEWDQSDLAKVSGLSLSSVATLEQGKASPRPSTWKAIQQALEEAGIEFLPDPGVRLRREKFQFQLLEGHDSIPKVWRDIEACYVSNGGEVLLSGVDESIWIKKYKNELRQIIGWRTERDIITRFLICEGDVWLTADVKYYRAIPKVLFQQTPYYVYADRLAIINWETPQTVLLIQNSMIAETFRRQFEFNWSIGKELNAKKVVIAKL